MPSGGSKQSEKLKGNSTVPFDSNKNANSLSRFLSNLTDLLLWIPPRPEQVCDQDLGRVLSADSKWVYGFCLTKCRRTISWKNFKGFKYC